MHSIVVFAELSEALSDDVAVVMNLTNTWKSMCLVLLNPVTVFAFYFQTDLTISTVGPHNNVVQKNGSTELIASSAEQNQAVVAPLPQVQKISVTGCVIFHIGELTLQL